MTQATHDFTAPAKAQIDAMLRATTIASDGMSKLFDLNTRTARETLEEITGTLQAVASVKDPADLRTLMSKTMKPDLEKSQAYAKTVYEQITATQSELIGLVEAQMAEMNKQIASTLDNVFKSAPAGSEAFVSAFKSAMSTANQAYETSMQTFKEAGSTITSGITTAQPGKRKAA
jgi:phasin family protein